MRKQKLLIFKPFKIANLNTSKIIGGTDDPTDRGGDTKTKSKKQQCLTDEFATCPAF